ncbi:hypothetical protein AOQ84DRAFT_395271 [Glonium stellatum]|uniref:Uncharacterized protein n=1 Tax=Glonium stellatum TaxID=574774 RepID=A0A8E2JXT2_9PEZI|nr:hypothetical protein AOQ84DRAFT_395271 [Glonium stellatum]
MFCLRSWIPILFFLTNASPVYLVLFISVTYFLNRPCVYCSLLLAILVVSLFDFHTAWFEPRLPYDQSSRLPSNETNPTRNGAFETASIIASAVNSTAETIVKAAVDGIHRRAPLASQTSGGAGFEWAKGLVGKKEWRIPCLDVLVRI